MKSLSNARVASSQVFAADLDSGLYGLIEYSLLADKQAQVFQIDAQSGVITANGILDYEFTSSYRFVPDSCPYDQLSAFFLTTLLLL